MTSFLLSQTPLGCSQQPVPLQSVQRGDNEQSNRHLARVPRPTPRGGGPFCATLILQPPPASHLSTSTRTVFDTPACVILHLCLFSNIFVLHPTRITSTHGNSTHAQTCKYIIVTSSTDYKSEFSCLLLYTRKKHQ